MEKVVRDLIRKTALLGFCAVFSLCSIAPAANVLYRNGAEAKAAVNRAEGKTADDAGQNESADDAGQNESAENAGQNESADDSGIGTTDWRDSIPQMLNAGKYEEGVVVAGISKEKAKNSRGKELMTVEESSVEAAADENGQEIEDCGDIEIRTIRSKNKTTEEILSELAADDSVIFAEPNYIAMNSSLSEDTGDKSAITGIGDVTGKDTAEMKSAKGESDDASAKSADTSELKPAESVKDISSLQYSNTKDASLHAPGDLNPSINVPNFNETGGNMNGDPVTVAVMDYPVDFSNSDLGKVAYTFTKEEQTMLGCDEHGFNATWQSKDGIIKPFKGGDHGSHCAGILGAAWDGEGISGVASNVRIVSIQNSLADGKTSLINNLRGLEFVKRANEKTNADIRLVSNSWGLIQNSLALSAAVNQLGKEQGVVNIFAAGNDAMDVSSMDDIGTTMVSNPYAISVASTNFDCRLSGFSNYGGSTVDLAAPGGCILSTVMSDHLKYIPDAVDSNKVYEGFEENDPTVKISQQDSSGSEKGETKIVSGKDEYGFAGERALKVELDKTVEKGSNPDYNIFDIVVDTGNVSSRGLKEGDSVAFSYLTEKKSLISEVYFKGIDDRWIKCEDNPPNILKKKEWVIFGANIPKGADLKKLKVKIRLALGKSGKNVYFDSFGVGNEGVPYAIYNGTSMACPAVSGAAAVIISEDPKIKGRKLINKIRSRVRRLPGLKGRLKTEGIIDLSVGSENDPAGPVINDIEVKGNTLTITGNNFGSQTGKVKASKYVAGKKGKTKKSKVKSWSNRKIVVTRKKDYKGMIKAVVTSSSGKIDSIIKYFSKSKNVYEKDLPMDISKGNPFRMDAMGDLETGGPLLAYKSKLLYMPAQTMVENTPVYGTCYSYDTSGVKWKSMTKLPAHLEKVSACICDGRMYVKGKTATKNGRIRVFVYNIKKKKWKETSAAGVQNEETIFTKGNKVMLCGGYSSIKNGEISGNGHIKVYSRSKGAGKIIATLKECMDAPLVTVFDEKIYVYDRELRALTVVSGSKADVYEDAVPKKVNNEAETDEASLITVTDGVMLIGMPASDGSSDTFLMKRGKKVFVPYEKRLSDGKPVQPAAAFCGNKVYATAGVITEKRGRVFRCTSYSSGAKKILMAKAEMKGKRKAGFKWSKVRGADKYVVYLGSIKRGKKSGLKKVKVLSGSRLNWTYGKLKKRTKYKFKVVALDKTGKSSAKYTECAKSKAGYFISGNIKGKYSNPGGISLSKNEIILNPGRTDKIKARVSKIGYRKKLMTDKAPRMRYVSSNSRVATVSKKGKVTGKGYGICRIYAFTINGIWKEVKVRVEP